MAGNTDNLAEALAGSEVIELLGGERAIESRRKLKRPRSGAPRRATKSRPAAIEEGRASHGRGAARTFAQGLATNAFRVAALDHLAERLNVAPGILMELLGITGRTAQRRRQQGVLSAGESDRLYRVARVLRHAIDVFGAEDSAIDWLRNRQSFLELHAPLELLGSDAGAQVVEQELGRIEYGDFS